MTRPVVVGPAEGAGLPGDDRRLVDLDDPERPSVVETRRGIMAVRGTDGAPKTTVLVRPLGSARSGATLVEAVADGWRFILEVEDAERAALRRRATRDRDTEASSGPTSIRAIIPGRVAAVHVVAGNAVEAGRGLLVVEAMKMQNELRAPRDGVVERVAVAAGQTIEPGDLLVMLR